MKLRTYVALLRPGYALFFGGSIGLLAAGIGYAVFQRHQSLEARLFTSLLLLAPYYGGGMLSQFFHGILHRPATLTLPGIERLFWRVQLPLLLAIAGLLATAAIMLGSTLPWPTAACVAWLSLTLSLPMEPGQRWRGQRWITAAITAALLASLLFAEAVFAAVRAHAGIVGVVAGGLALATVAIASDRRRLRQRVFFPLLIGPDVLDRSQLDQVVADRAQRQGLRGFWQRAGRIEFDRAPVRGSPRRLLRAAQLARFGSESAPRNIALLMPLLMIGLLAFFATIPLLTSGQAVTGAAYLRQLYEIVWLGGGEPAGMLGIMIMVAPLGAVVANGAQTPGFTLLPVSRAAKLHLSRVLFYRLLGLIWLGILVFAVVASVATSLWWAGTFWGDSVPTLLRMALDLPAIALFATWAMIGGRQSTDSRRSVSLLARIALVATAALVAAVITLRLPLGEHLGILLVTTALAAVLFHRRDRHRFLRQDLVTRPVH